MDKKISELDVNPSITGTEEVPTERNSSNYKNTYTSLKTWILSGLNIGVETVNGDGVNNADPLNPVLSFPNADEVDDSTTTNKFATGTNTGDETTATIQAKRPIKTINSKSLEGTGDQTLDGTEVFLVDGGIVSVTAAIGDLENSVTDLETNKVNSVIVGEPTGSDVILNAISLTQAEYDAGTPIATTIYNITDA